MTSVDLSYLAASAPRSVSGFRSNQASIPPRSTSAATSFDQLSRSWMQIPRLFVDEQRNRHAPGALPRHAPIGASGDHAADPLLAPTGHPVHVRDRLERAFSKTRLIHADEPLGRCAKNDRRLVAPAMRIGMMIWSALEQTAALTQDFDDVGVRLEHLFAREENGRRQEPAIAAHGIFDLPAHSAGRRYNRPSRARAPCHRAAPVPASSVT